MFHSYSYSVFGLGRCWLSVFHSYSYSVFGLGCGKGLGEDGPPPSAGFFLGDTGKGLALERGLDDDIRSSPSRGEERGLDSLAGSLNLGAGKSFTVKVARGLDGGVGSSLRLSRGDGRISAV